MRFVVYILSWLLPWFLVPDMRYDEVFSPLCLGMLLLLVLLQGFAFANFKRGQLPTRRFIFQFGTVLGVTAAFMCAAVISISIIRPRFD